MSAETRMSLPPSRYAQEIMRYEDIQFLKILAGITNTMNISPFTQPIINALRGVDPRNPCIIIVGNGNTLALPTESPVALSSTDAASPGFSFPQPEEFSGTGETENDAFKDLLNRFVSYATTVLTDTNGSLYAKGQLYLSFWVQPQVMKMGDGSYFAFMLCDVRSIPLPFPRWIAPPAVPHADVPG